jgi:magnesium chelatase family protein
MLAKTLAAAVLGVEAQPIEVEVDLAFGHLPVFTIVGLPDGTVRESKERIVAAFANIGLALPIRRITVNLAPAELRKVGSGFDLPIAAALIGATGLAPPEALDGLMWVGELALDGRVRAVRGVLAIALKARELGLKGLVLPKENEREAGIAEGLSLYPIERLDDAVKVLRGETAPVAPTGEAGRWFAEARNGGEDLRDVKGQEQIKRALEIAAAGNHHLLMMGPPGSGKTMLARRLGGILPRLTFEEALETTRIHSIAGLLSADRPLALQRPFRSPHHSVSSAGLVGGGSVPQPGEISLAHNGVLFLDELPEFPREVLELLRQPLEDRRITISRAAMALEFPCSVLLVCAMNPCPCGFQGDANRRCTCSPQAVQKYRARISGPLLDRIDLQVDVPSAPFDKLTDARRGEPSAAVQARVQRARERQERRFQDSPTRCNGMMSPAEIEAFAIAPPEGVDLLRRASERLGLSARAYSRILKVARTIADLADSETLQTAHLAEAIQYRKLDRPVG